MYVRVRLFIKYKLILENGVSFKNKTPNAHNPRLEIGIIIFTKNLL